MWSTFVTFFPKLVFGFNFYIIDIFLTEILFNYIVYFYLNFKWMSDTWLISPVNNHIIVHIAW